MYINIHSLIKNKKNKKTKRKITKAAHINILVGSSYQTFQLLSNVSSCMIATSQRKVWSEYFPMFVWVLFCFYFINYFYLLLFSLFFFIYFFFIYFLLLFWAFFNMIQYTYKIIFFSLFLRKRERTQIIIRNIYYFFV